MCMGLGRDLEGFPNKNLIPTVKHRDRRVMGLGLHCCSGAWPAHHHRIHFEFCIVPEGALDA